jgi:16S rRNA (cytosine1402-N4)-methyltransferase
MASYLHLLEGERPDKILADLGMSSLQLDLPERGFSFHYPDAPLDLRMNPEEGVPAWQYLQDMDLRSLILLLREIGGLRDPRPVALQLKNNLPRTMGELREVLASYRFREKRGNLENRVLLALRVALNQELELLYALLVELPFYAKPGSRVVFLTYHSAEDHLVKWAFRAYARGELPPPPPFLKILMGKDLPVDPISWYESWVEKEKGSFSPSFSKKSFPPGRILTPKPLFPTPEEIARNPRSHSAHLRAFQFGEAMR